MGGQKQAVLLVDDEAPVCRVLGQFLARDFRVHTATSSEEALGILEREPVDAIVSDFAMPLVNGVELLVQAAAIQPGAVRLMMTGSENLDHARDAINLARISRFVSKPVRGVDLLAMVHGALRETELERDNIRLVQELQDRNLQLEGALERLQAQELALEQTVSERTDELRRAVSKLEELALRDGLTGLYNHRHLQEVLSAELARSTRHGHQCGLVFIDVDNFKNYNDRIGHQGGDALLRAIARVLRGEAPGLEPHNRGRSSDVAARYGGEEFLLILPETGKEGAVVRAERLRKAVEAFPFENQEVQPNGLLTVSVGVAAFPDDANTKEELIEAADQALLSAKREGKNRVVAAARPR